MHAAPMTMQLEELQRAVAKRQAKLAEAADADGSVADDPRVVREAQLRLKKQEQMEKAKRPGPLRVASFALSRRRRKQAEHPAPLQQQTPQPPSSSATVPVEELEYV